MKTINEIKEKYPLLIEIKQSLINPFTTTYKDILNKDDRSLKIFDKIYNYNLEIYLKKKKSFDDLEKHLNINLPSNWIKVMPCVNYIVLDNKNKIIITQMLNSGLYQTSGYNLNGRLMSIELINQLDGYETKTDYLKRQTEMIKESFSETSKGLKKTFS